MKFNIDDYEGAVVMHCPTQESATIFCNHLASAGRCWANGQSYVNNTLWYYYEDATVYAFNKGRRGSIRDNIVLSNYVVLEFDDFDWGDAESQFNLITFADLLAGTE